MRMTSCLPTSLLKYPFFVQPTELPPHFSSPNLPAHSRSTFPLSSLHFHFVHSSSDYTPFSLFSTIVLRPRFFHALLFPSFCSTLHFAPRQPKLARVLEYTYLVLQCCQVIPPSPSIARFLPVSCRHLHFIFSCPLAFHFWFFPKARSRIDDVTTRCAQASGTSRVMARILNFDRCRSSVKVEKGSTPPPHSRMDNRRHSSTLAFPTILLTG